MPLKLRIVERDSDHFVVYADEPCRIEVSLLPIAGEGCAVIMHTYRGLNLDLQQEPDLTYDGSERKSMVDMDSPALDAATNWPRFTPEGDRA